MANIKQTVKLGVFTLAIMNVTAVVSLRGLPAEAVYGMSSAFYYLFAAIVFLIPTSLVAAELAAMFQDKQGGVFRWVGEAYGKKLGFLAIWVQWIESTIWYPTVLTFGAVSIAFIGMNDVHDMSLANNKYYSLVVVLIIYWLATFISMKGMSWVGKVAKVGGLVGTIIPAALLIILGIIYLATGGHSNLDFHSSFFPRLDELRQRGACCQYLPLLCRYGNGRYPRKRREQSLQELSEGSVHRCGHYGYHLRARYFLTGHHHPGQRHQSDTESACRLR